MRPVVLAAVALFIAVAAWTTVAARFQSSSEVSRQADRSTPAVPGQTAPTVPAVPSPTSEAGPAGGAGTPAGTPAPTGLRYAEVSTHATPTDCWIVVNGRVYDVTSYLRDHPGGTETITPWCGKESTVAYETEDGAGTHSSRADRLLETYYIGDLTP